MSQFIIVMLHLEMFNVIKLIVIMLSVKKDLHATRRIVDSQHMERSAQVTLSIVDIQHMECSA